MKRIASIILIAAVPLSFYSCELLSALGESDVAAGLKQALTVSTDTSSTRLSRPDGYYNNPVVRILLPPEAEAVETTLRGIPGIGNAFVDELILKMNRAAETAATEAAPIFKNAITNITITDAVTILNGPDDAATQYLKQQTFSQLHSAFTPHIQDALEQVGAQQLWFEMTTIYNTYNDLIPGSQNIPDNLASHTTSKALDGLFHLIAIEEGKIRNDINHQVTDLLRQVFGN